MIAKHVTTFLETARLHQCQIVVREPNPLADKWITSGKGFPKPVTCSAKTADVLGHPWGGLVFNPDIHDDAFSDWGSAMENWDSFVKNGIPSGYEEVLDGPEAGVLKYSGRHCPGMQPIFADYDLMCILPIASNGKVQPTRGSIVKPDSAKVPWNAREHAWMYDANAKAIYDLFYKVCQTANERFGIPMIQHGPEFLYNGVGAKASERIYFFAPDNKMVTGHSSMSTQTPH